MAGKQLISQYDGTLVKVGTTFQRVDKGAALPDGADEEHVKVLLERGMVAKGEPAAGFVDPGGVQPLFTPDADGSDDGKKDSGGRPPQAANREAWERYAVSQGLTEEEAKAFPTKQELIDRFKD